MSHSLYCLKKSNGDFTFGVKPYDDQYWAEYHSLNHRISLKNDLNWEEVKHLQKVLVKSDIWENFPVKGVTLVNNEFKPGDEDQRLDLLYLREDGALIPCELKIGGTNKESHGQLMRYIADLHFETLNLDWIRNQVDHFLAQINDDATKDIHSQKVNEFIEQNTITDKYIRLLQRTGILIDEGFKPQLLKTVRYLNGYCGFAFRLIDIETYVTNSNILNQDEFKFRIDFVDIQ